MSKCGRPGFGCGDSDCPCRWDAELQDEYAAWEQERDAAAIEDHESDMRGTRR